MRNDPGTRGVSWGKLQNRKGRMSSIHTRSAAWAPLVTARSSRFCCAEARLAQTAAIRAPAQAALSGPKNRYGCLFVPSPLRVRAILSLGRLMAQKISSKWVANAGFVTGQLGAGRRGKKGRGKIWGGIAGGDRQPNSPPDASATIRAGSATELRFVVNRLFNLQQ